MYNYYYYASRPRPANPQDARVSSYHYYVTIIHLHGALMRRKWASFAKKQKKTKKEEKKDIHIYIYIYIY